MSTDTAELDQLVGSLRERGALGTEIAFVLGSGLGDFVERLADAERIPYGELEGMPQSGVAGHAGELAVGTIAGVRVLVQRGRVHLYEGWPVSTVVRAVRAFAQLGCSAVVLTNAAGGLRPEWSPGTLMRITDHLNLQGRPPLDPGEVARGAPYDDALGAALVAGAADAGQALQEGVYAALLGPAYETPAEIRFLRWIGADAVGMSTAAEATAARAAGLRAAAISLISNPAAGLGAEKLSHTEVVEAGRRVAEGFGDLLEAAVPRLHAALGEG